MIVFFANTLSILFLLHDRYKTESVIQPVLHDVPYLLLTFFSYLPDNQQCTLCYYCYISFYAISKWKVLLLCFWLVFLLLSYEGFKANTVVLADHSIVEAEWPVLLVLGDEFAIATIRYQFLYGLAVGVERLESLWRNCSAKVFWRVLQIMKD